MTEPIKLPPLPLEDALKRAYYYTETGEWRYPESCTEWDRWHAVAKAATLTGSSPPESKPINRRPARVVPLDPEDEETFRLAVEQATAGLRDELEEMHADKRRAEDETTQRIARAVEQATADLRAELARRKKLGEERSVEYENKVWEAVVLMGRAEKAEAERDEARAELARLTTLRPASEHKGEPAIWFDTEDNGNTWDAHEVGSVPLFDAPKWTPLPPVKEADK